MKTKLHTCVAAAALIVASTPVWASAVAVPVPEPGSLSLLALGVAGVVIGHRFWRNK